MGVEMDRNNFHIYKENIAPFKMQPCWELGAGACTVDFSYGISLLRSKLSLRAEVSGVALGNCVVAFAEPTVPLVAAWSSGLNVTFFG